MNYIYISHKTAFAVYRLNRKFKDVSTLPNIQNFHFNSKENISNRQIDKELLDLYNLSEIDILLSSKNSCYRGIKVKRHCCKGPLPKNSFRILKKKIAIVSPELLFCQMANYLDPINLMLLGLELCGTFVTDNETEKGFVNNLRPITSKQKILKYINDLAFCNSNFRGLNKAKIIAKHLGDNSASPQESRLYTSLAAPRKLGGYGIKGLQLNKPIQLSKQAKQICGQNYLVPDLCCQKNKIVIEYDSDYYHDNSGQNSKDKQRINAYTHQG